MSRRARPRQLQVITPEEELENLRNEVGVLRRAVESKSAAVGILRAELQECQKERDKFRTLAEQGTLHRSFSSALKPAYSDPCRSAMLSGSDGTLAQLLSQSKEENKILRQDATELRCKLHDAQADIKVLREEVQRSRGDEGRRKSHIHTTMSHLAHQEREQFISQMEELSVKCQALEGDVRGLVEEREELVRELDASSHKLHRLNYILNTVLSSISAAAPTPPKRIIDLDAIITENRYIQQRLKQSEEEKALAKSNASKYKAALEKCRSQGSLKLGTSHSLIVTPQQVGELLHDYRGEVGGAAESDLRSLCVALVDALNQRSRALRTQRSANKVLVGRISELERRLSTIVSLEEMKMDEPGASTVTVAAELKLASLGLMDGYTPPAGPITRYNEEKVIHDPRVAKFVCVTSLGQDPRERKCNEDLNNENLNGKCDDSLQDNSIANGESLGRNCENILDVPNTKVKLDAASSSLNDVSIVPNDNTAAATGVERNGEYETAAHAGEEETIINQHRKAVQGTVCDNEEEIIPENTVTSDGPRNRSLITNVTKAGKTTGSKGLLAVNGVSSKETNAQNIHETRMSTYVNPEDELEEIIPIDQLDSYIREVQLRRKLISNKLKEDKSSSDLSDASIASSKTEENKIVSEDSEVSIEPTRGVDPLNTLGVKADASKNEDEDDSSFDLNISDYDSDNDNLDVALQEWQNDFGKGKMKLKGSPTKDSKVKRASGKEVFNLWLKDSSPEAQLPPALKELLDRATGTLDDEVDCT
nr:uncharacterized protein LOC123771131 [Procambarus clarkii]